MSGVRAVTENVLVRPGEHTSFERVVFDSGLTLLLHDLPGSAVAAIDVVVDAGAVCDPVGLAGLGSVAAQAMVIAGDPAQLAGAGGRVSARVTWDAAIVSIRVPASAMGQAIGWLGELVLAPTVSDRLDVLVQQRRELARKSDLVPALRCGRELAKAMFVPASRFTHPVDGTSESLARLGADHVGEHLARRLAPGATAVIVAADLSLSPITDMIGEASVDWATHPDPTRSPNVTALFSTRMVDMAAESRCHAALGHALPSRHAPDHAALRLALAAMQVDGLGDLAATTRLDFHRHGGSWSVQVDVPTDRVPSALSRVADSVDRVQSGGPTESSVQAARSSLLRSIESRSDPSTLAGTTAELAAMALPDDTTARLRDELATCTLDEVRSAAARHLDPRRLAVALVGDAHSVLDGGIDDRFAPVTLVE